MREEAQEAAAARRKETARVRKRSVHGNRGPSGLAGSSSLPSLSGKRRAKVKTRLPSPTSPAAISPNESPPNAFFSLDSRGIFPPDLMSREDFQNAVVAPRLEEESAHASGGNPAESNALPSSIAQHGGHLSAQEAFMHELRLAC